MLKRIKKFGLPVVFGTALAVLAPTASFARDHDRDDRHEWRGHERRESREHEWREHHRYRGYYGPSYSYNYGYSRSGGYYDQWGNWHSYGYYDRWGNWHPY